MKSDNTLKSRTLSALSSVLLLGLSVSAMADSVDLSDEAGAQGQTVTVVFTYTGDGTQNALQAEAVISDVSQFSNIDDSDMCSGASAVVVSCQLSGNTLQFAAANGSGTPLASFTGEIDFTIDGAATVGTTVVLDWDEANVDFTPTTHSDGSIEILDVTSILNVQPANINFPATENGSSSSSQSFTISNDGTDSIDLEVTDVSLATGTDFSISASSCAATPFTLADGESCTYDAVFSPTAIGNLSDTVTVTSDAGQVTNDQVALSGEGTAGAAATLDIAPASHDFGDVLTGDSATFTFTVSNTGASGSSLDIDAIGLGGGTDFSISGGTCSVGDTLGDGDSCTVAVDFAPGADGAQSDTLTVDGTDTVNSTSVSDSAALDGNGVSEARFSSDPAPGGVNMGQAAPGGSLSQTVVVTNEGNENLTVNTCSLTDPDGVFSITPDPIDFTIAPDASDSFEVSCSVPTPGSFSASLSCDTNDPNNATVTYNFTCSGQILEIPTMQPWGLVLLTMLMLMIGGLSIRYFRI